MSTNELTDSSQGLPQRLDQLARDTPHTTWMIAPISPDPEHGWHNITFGEFATAVNGAAWWIEQHLGEGTGQEVVAYMGTNDVCYPVVIIALIKAGYKPMLPSLRNSLDGQVSLFETTRCRNLLHNGAVDVYIDPVKSAVPDLQACSFPSFGVCLRNGTKRGTYSARNSTKLSETVLVVHTSGSTGLPKPIYQTHGALCIIDNLRSQPVPAGRKSAIRAWTEPRPLLSMLPFFHTMGILSLVRSIYYAAPLIVMSPGRPVSADLVCRCIVQTNPWAVLLAPSIIEELCHTSGGLEALWKLEYVFYGGAPLDYGTGQKIQEKSNVINLIGATELVALTNLILINKDDWSYFEWLPGSGIVMELDGDDLYELVIKQDHADPKYAAVFHNFPHLREWRTRDLYSQHPISPGLWRYVGRKDDVLVLSNGEKLTPVNFESAVVAGHPLVQGAVVVGQARFQTGLIVEPNWSRLPQDQDLTDLIDTIWPVVEKANRDVPSHGRVWKSKIAIAKPGKPFKLSPKGGLVRRATVELYAAEIEALYANEEFDEQLSKLDLEADTAPTKEFLRKAFNLTLPRFPVDGPEDADLFDFGVDSLQILGLSSAINHTAGNSRQRIVTPKDIYNHPTIERLAKFLHLRSLQNNTTLLRSREKAMASIIDRLTIDLPSVSSPKILKHAGKHIVILTGSTGSLGSHILGELIASPQVGQVYCLNRSTDAQDRQQQSFKQRGISPDFSKVSFIRAEFGEARFGLPENVYHQLLQQVSTIIHNAWTVDFNIPLEAFEGVHLAGTRRCIEFSIHSTNQAHIVFVSSVAAVGNWSNTNSNGASKVPEMLMDNHAVALPQGYGESKHVAECMLGIASDRCRVPVTIIRAGQLAGSTAGNGIWNKQEWFPSIIATSKTMGVAPKTLGSQDVIDWVPIDLAARIMVELTMAGTADLNQGEAKARVFHVVNPNTSTWKVLVPVLQDMFDQIKIIPYGQWVDQLKTVPLTADEAKSKPGIKLLDFYERLRSSPNGYSALATTETASRSETLRLLEAVDERLMRRWLGQWQS